MAKLGYQFRVSKLAILASEKGQSVAGRASGWARYTQYERELVVSAAIAN